MAAETGAEHPPQREIRVNSFAQFLEQSKGQGAHNMILMLQQSTVTGRNFDNGIRTDYVQYGILYRGLTLNGANILYQTVYDRVEIPRASRLIDEAQRAEQQFAQEILLFTAATHWQAIKEQMPDAITFVFDFGKRRYEEVTLQKALEKGKEVDDDGNPHNPYESVR